MPFLPRNPSSPSLSQQQYALPSAPAPITSDFNTMPPSPPDRSFVSRVQIHSTQIPQAWVPPLCGAGAGVASGIVTCPLDVIKTKLQAQGGFLTQKGGKLASANLVYNGLFGSAKVIWREDGIRGLYRGLGPMLLGYIPTWAVYLTVYDRSRASFEQMSGNWWLARGCASLTAGACSTILTNPIWVIKTRLQSQSNRGASDGFRAPWHYSSTIDAVRKMYRNEGLRSFYSGLAPALLGLTHVAIQFPLYEYFKTRFTGYGFGEHPDTERSSHWVGVSLATFLSKVCASTATYPHEVLRTRMQTQQISTPEYTEGVSNRGRNHLQSDRGRPPGPSSSDGMPTRPRYRGIIRTTKMILAEEGWRAFYAGIGTNLFRAVPAAMTTMLSYEWLQGTVRRLQAEGEKQLEPTEDVPV